MEIKSMLEMVKKEMDTENAAREQGLKLSRESIRLSANSIRAAHRGERDECQRLLEASAETMGRAQSALDPHPRIYYAGFLQDAEKEYSEARATRALIEGEDLPLPDELGVGIAPYLNGLGEAVGELRRHVLDLMRTGNLDRGEELLGTMDDIFFLLTSVDYPDALTGGLRRTTDIVRGILERTRGDLTNAIRQNNLERRIRSFEQDLENKKTEG